MAEVKAGSPQDKRWAKLVPESTPKKKRKKAPKINVQFHIDTKIDTGVLEKEIESLALENEQLRKKYTAEKQKCTELEANLKMFNDKIDRLQKQAAVKKTPTAVKPQVQRRSPAGKKPSANA